MNKIMRSLYLLPVLVLAACAGGGQTPAVVAVPDALKGAPNEKLALVVPAKGVQIYECRAVKDKPGNFEWAFVAPEAELFDTRGTKIGKHYGGPSWESNDGSKITGALKARADAPQAGTIPWLLITATPAGPKGAFSDITSVQRVNTVGGAAPSAACTQGNTGTVVRAPYTADYYLLSTK